MISNLKIFQFVLTFLGSFIGQLIVRITTLDGSLDQWWLLIPPLSVPPLSLIPAYLIYNDNVEKGYSGIPLDVYIIIPAISSIFFNIIIEKNYEDPGPVGCFIKFLINYLTFTIALYLRDVDQCLIVTPIQTNSASNKKKNYSYNEEFTQLQKFNEQFNLLELKPSVIVYNKVFFQSAIICAFLPILPYIIIKIPILRNMVATVGTISPVIAQLIDSTIRLIAIVFIYCIMNMYNGSTPDRLCKQPFETMTVVYAIIVSVIINLLFSYKTDLVSY